MKQENSLLSKECDKNKFEKKTEEENEDDEEEIEGAAV